MKPDIETLKGATHSMANNEPCTLTSSRHFSSFTKAGLIERWIPKE